MQVIYYAVVAIDYYSRHIVFGQYISALFIACSVRKKTLDTYLCHSYTLVIFG